MSAIVGEQTSIADKELTFGCLFVAAPRAAVADIDVDGSVHGQRPLTARAGRSQELDVIDVIGLGVAGGGGPGGGVAESDEAGAQAPVRGSERDWSCGEDPSVRRSARALLWFHAGPIELLSRSRLGIRYRTPTRQ